MALNLSKAEKKELEAELSVATPFSEDEMLELDGHIDTARFKATMAKKFLQEADKEASKE